MDVIARNRVMSYIVTKMNCGNTTCKDKFKYKKLC